MLCLWLIRVTRSETTRKDITFRKLNRTFTLASLANRHISLRKRVESIDIGIRLRGEGRLGVGVLR